MKHFAMPAALLLLAAPEFALASEPASKETGADERTRVICKTEKQLGTRTRKLKSCRTVQEWEDLRGQIKQHMDKQQMRQGSKQG